MLLNWNNSGQLGNVRIENNLLSHFWKQLERSFWKFTSLNKLTSKTYDMSNSLKIMLVSIKVKVLSLPCQFISVDETISSVLEIVTFWHKSQLDQ